MTASSEEVQQLLAYVSQTTNICWIKAVDEVLDDQATKEKIAALAGANMLRQAAEDLRLVTIGNTAGTLDALSPEEIAMLLDDPREG